MVNIYAEYEYKALQRLQNTTNQASTETEPF